MPSNALLALSLWLPCPGTYPQRSAIVCLIVSPLESRALPFLCFQDLCSAGDGEGTQRCCPTAIIQHGHIIQHNTSWLIVSLATLHCKCCLLFQQMLYVHSTADTVLDCGNIDGNWTDGSCLHASRWVSFFLDYGLIPLWNQSVAKVTTITVRSSALSPLSWFRSSLSLTPNLVDRGLVAVPHCSMAVVYLHICAMAMMKPISSALHLFIWPSDLREPVRCS